MTVPFPLLRLPRLALIPVFQEMEPIDVIAVSLLSKKVYNVSKIFRKLSVRCVNMIVDNNHLCITVDLRNGKSETFYFYKDRVADLDDLMIRYRWFTHENTGLSASQWLERVIDVTNFESLEELYLCGSPQLEVCDALARLTNLRKLSIMFDCSDSFAKRALDILSPVSTKITLFKIPFESKEEFQKFLKSNLSYLNIETSTFPNFQFTLKDLIVTNALKLNLNSGKLNLKEINQFFKNWMENKCDPRLEHLIVSTSEKVNARNLLDGLNAVFFARDRRRAFRYSKQLDSFSESFSGGYDIRRADGKKATITYAGYSGPTVINFYVWP
ncbi:hypothetical protein GCK72_021141 [Caenorhabditis remanei]|uniref:F-box domain-containing protein n=1 Tax=Caenorhabditis remanei TaxID=31234 RepID=A0A6A5GHA8_CAERE|nr:hypothetical protein GCK72_021141 [Caenorhabditis remanei]KAF1754578.1 hypothetical protein GCK72_021141 [Caenorhabditis remanei]